MPQISTPVPVGSPTIPIQTGHAEDVLSTDGENLDWADSGEGTDISEATILAIGSTTPRAAAAWVSDVYENVIAWGAVATDGDWDEDNAAINQVAFESASAAAAINGKRVLCPPQVSEAGDPMYYDLDDTVIELEYHGGHCSGLMGGTTARLRWDQTTPKPGIIIDCFKNCGNVDGIHFTFANSDRLNAASNFIQIGSGRGSSPSINANLTTKIFNNFFGEGSFRHVSSNQECDNTEIYNNISFSNVGGNNVDAARIYLEMSASNREAPSANVRIYNNHFSQPDCDPGDNKYGIVVVGSDSLFIDNNTVNNHDCNYGIFSPSNASMRENTAPVVKQPYFEEQRTWVKNATVFAINTAYSVGDILVAPDADANGLIGYVTVAGTSAGTLPSFGGSGNDNFGPGTTVSTITSGTMAMEMRYASVGVMVSGEGRRCQIIAPLAKGVIQAIQARGACRLEITQGNTTVFTPDVKVWFGVSGFQNSQGTVTIDNSTCRGNMRPYRTAPTDATQFRVKIIDSPLTNDLTALFPTDGRGTYYYGYPSNDNTRIVTASGAITMTTRDRTLLINKTVGAASAVAGASGPTTYQRFLIKDAKGDAASNNITFTPNAGLVDGAATMVISTNYGWREIIWNGTDYNVIGTG